MAAVSGGMCPNCFRNTISGGKCRQCGYDAAANKESKLVLPPGKVLNGQYTIGKVLGIGGFGVTYLAKQNRTDKRCAIKEYFPTAIAIRNADASVTAGNNQDTFRYGLKAFFTEAETLKTFLGRPNIVQILGSFQENGTAYYAMEYLDGMNAAVLTTRVGGQLPYIFAIEILQRISDALLQVHRQGLLHRDVSPENIFITRDGQVKLIDFGTTRFFIGERSMSLSVVLKPGFAPPEQYSTRGNQGPWTDIYALAATFYYFCTGRVLPDALDRLAGKQISYLKDIVPGMSSAISEIIDVALRLDLKDRFQTIDNFLSVVQAEVSEQAKQKQPQQPKPPPQSQQQPSPGQQQQQPPGPPQQQQQRPQQQQQSPGPPPPQYQNPQPSPGPRQPQRPQPQPPPQQQQRQQQPPPQQQQRQQQQPSPLPQQQQSPRPPPQQQQSPGPPPPQPQPGPPQPQPYNPQRGTPGAHSSAGAPYLSIVSGKFRGNRWKLEDNIEIVIGRSAKECGIVVNDPGVSRKHCVILYDAGKRLYYIKDTSTNGTFSETGQRLTPEKIYTLMPDSRFYLSSPDFMFMVGLE